MGSEWAVRAPLRKASPAVDLRLGRSVGVGVGKKSPGNPRIGVPTSELGAWGYGERLG